MNAEMELGETTEQLVREDGESFETQSEELESIKPQILTKQLSLSERLTVSGETALTSNETKQQQAIQSMER